MDYCQGTGFYLNEVSIHTGNRGVKIGMSRLDVLQAIILWGGRLKVPHMGLAREGGGSERLKL